MHNPVLLEEIKQIFSETPTKSMYVIDGTLGLGGHTAMFAQNLQENGKIFAFEWDEENLKIAKQNLQSYDNIRFFHKNYTSLGEIIYKEGLEENIQFILFDLGVASPHLDEAHRGFSYKKEGVLDMRFDTSSGMTAYELLSMSSEKELANIFFHYGEVQESFRIAKKIVEYRKTSIIRKTVDLVRLLEEVYAKFPPAYRTKQIVKIFQSIRIAVNHELANIEKVLLESFRVLSKGGRLAIISYHSLEDRLVKQFYQNMSRGCICDSSVPVCICGRKPQAKIVYKKPILPSAQEIEQNPRSRSAKLRVLEKF